MGDSSKRPLERSGEGKQLGTATGEIKGEETTRNGNWKFQERGDSEEQRRNQVRRNSAELPLERSREGRHYGTATGKYIGGKYGTVTVEMR